MNSGIRYYSKPRPAVESFQVSLDMYLLVSMQGFLVLALVCDTQGMTACALSLSHTLLSLLSICLLQYIGWIVCDVIVTSSMAETAPTIELMITFQKPKQDGKILQTLFHFYIINSYIEM